MNGSQDLVSMLTHGGGTVLLLAVLSLYSIYVIFDRTLRVAKASRWDQASLDQGLSLLEDGKNRELSVVLESSGGPLWARLLRAAQTKTSERKNAVRNELELCMDTLEAPLVHLATIGATAPFIGLFGTVLGIMKAFKALGANGGGGMAIVGPGIAEALFATAAGLFVAIPAVAAYNLIGRSAERLRGRAERLVSRILGDA